MSSGEHECSVEQEKGGVRTDGGQETRTEDEHIATERLISTNRDTVRLETGRTQCTTLSPRRLLHP